MPMEGKPRALSVVGIALDILQIVFAILVVVLVSWKLTNVEVDGINVKSSCILNGSDDSFLGGTGFCVYAIVVGLASLIVNVIFGCLRKLTKCLTLNMCAASNVVTVIGDTILGIWWAFAFGLFVKRGTAATNLGFPERGARDGVIAAAFGAMIAFFADVVVTVVGVAMS